MKKERSRLNIDNKVCVLFVIHVTDIRTSCIHVHATYMYIHVHATYMYIHTCACTYICVMKLVIDM